MRLKTFLSLFAFVATQATIAQIHTSDDNKFIKFDKPPLLQESIMPVFKPSSEPLNPTMFFLEKLPQNELPATWEEFKLKFLRIPLSQELVLTKRFYDNMEMGKKYVFNSLWFDPEEHIRNINCLNRGGVGGGISFSVFQPLYDKFSHEGKMIRKYNELVREDKMEQQLLPKYNIELIKEITGLSSDSAVYVFMKFCDFKNESLLHASDYNVYLMIQNCWRSFELFLKEETY